MISIDHFFLLLIFSYILKRSAANKLASNPPVPALISIIAFFVSASSFGNKNNFNFFSLIDLFSCNWSSSNLAKSFISWSFLLSDKILSRSFSVLSKDRYCFATKRIEFKLEYSFEIFAKFFLSIDSDDNFFSKIPCLVTISFTLS